MNSESQILGSVEELRHLVQVLVWIGAIGAAALVLRTIIEAYATWRPAVNGSRPMQRIRIHTSISESLPLTGIGTPRRVVQCPLRIVKLA